MPGVDAMGVNDSRGQMDLSSIGEAMDWSPKESTKRSKRKGFVRLSSYENQCFSTLAGGVSGASPISQSRSHRNVLDSAGKSGRAGGAAPITPIKQMHKSASSKICRSA